MTLPWNNALVLIKWTVYLTRVLPIKPMHIVQAGFVRSRIERLMADIAPTSTGTPMPFTFSVSEPISAVVVAALYFLSTPAGQQLVTDVRTETIALLKFAHKQTGVVV